LYHRPTAATSRKMLPTLKAIANTSWTRGLYPLHRTQFLDDANDTDRLMGLYAGMSMLERCDEFWMFGDTISDGMRLELQEAIRLNKPIGFVQVEWEDAV
jgi:hypothetical protein